MPEPLSALVIHDLAAKVVDVLAHGVLERLLKRRFERASELLKRRLAKGVVWAWTEDETAAALFTYMRAAQEGAARLNLQLMADALASGAQEPTFAPDAFRRHCVSLSTLSRDEVFMLAALIKVHELARAAGDEEINPGWLIRHSPSDYGLGSDVDIEGCANALTRTGWVVVQSVYGGMGFDLSSSFAEVRRLVDFAAAVKNADRH